MRQLKTYLLLFLILSVLASCKKKEFNDPNWDVDILAPLMKTTITIDQMIEDSLSQINSDNSISLIYKNEIYRFTIDSLFQIPDTSIEYTAKLNNLDLGTIEISARKSLGDIAMYDYEENGPTGNLYNTIMTGHNTGTPTVIDAVTQQTYNDLVIDATDYFQTATFQSGYIDIEFDNGMPLDFTNVYLELRNQQTQDIILQDTFLLIPANGNVMHTKSLAGLTISGNMEGSVSFESPGSAGAVIIDTSMAMVVNITVRDIALESATAIFPSQNIVEQGETASFNAGSIQLHEAQVKDGHINVVVYNTIKEPIHYEFSLPEAKLNGNPLTLSGIVPAASGNPGQITIHKDISGYNLNLRGIGPVEQAQGDLNGNNTIDPDTINTIYYTLTGRIDSSGNLISLSLDDSIYVRLDFSEITPQYAKGYLGQDIINVSGNEPVTTFKDILDGTLDIDDVKISLSVSNQIGAIGGIYINSLVSKNTVNSTQTALIVPAQYNPFIINKPVDPLSAQIPVNPTLNTMFLDKNNSNPDKLIEIMPNQFDYDMSLQINPNVLPPAPGTGTDFIYYNSEVVVSLDVELPLNLIANNITLCDTSEFNLDSAEVERINGGNLNLYAYNGFPLEAKVQLYLLDDNYNIIDSLLIPEGLIMAGNYDFTTGIVTDKKQTKLTIPVDKDRLYQLVNTSYIKTLTKFTTCPYNTHVKIYNDYELDLKLVGDFSYHIN